MRRIVAVALVALLGPFILRTGGASVPSSCGTAPAGETALGMASGTFTQALQGSYVLVPFAVPSGMTRVRARICYDQPQIAQAGVIRNTLDLGLYEPTTDGAYDTEEFRGWGGSSRPNVLITPEASTTVGFDPGPIPAGDWAAEIGVASVLGPSDGAPDATVSWRLEFFGATFASDTDDPFVPVAYDEAPARAGWGWYAGDFHVHALNSNPSDAPMSEVFDYAFGPAGLDFITLSDYVGRRQWDEIGAFQAAHPSKLIIRSAEVITYRGHVNNHGSHRFVDYRTGPVYLRAPDGTLTLARAQRPASAIFGAIHDAGGWTQVNHPTIFPSSVPAFASYCRGCSWEFSDAETDWSAVDAFEVQTGPAGTPGQTNQELGPNPFTPPAIAWWDRLRAQGFDITAVGSSDSHKAGRPNGFPSNPTDITRAPIGEATTVVWANGLSEASIGAAIKAGHAYVKFFGNGGPDLRFTADGGAIMGDTVHGSTASFEARVLGGGPNPQPRALVVLRDGVPILSVPVTSSEFSFSFTGVVPGAYRLQLQRGSAIEALTNPITLSP